MASRYIFIGSFRRAVNRILVHDAVVAEFGGSLVDENIESRCQAGGWNMICLWGGLRMRLS